MHKIVRYGIFGFNEVEVDDDGFIEIPVVIQESGLFVGAPPPELRIVEVLPSLPEDSEFNRQYVAKINRRTDLPFYLATVKIKVTGQLEKVTDEMLTIEGIEPLKDDSAQQAS